MDNDRTGERMYEDELIDLRVYVDALLRRRRLIVTLALLAAVGAFVTSLLLPPTYEAAAAIAVTPRRSNIILTEDFLLSEDELGRVDVQRRGDALLEIANSLKTSDLVLKTEPELLTMWEGGPQALARAVEVELRGDLLVITAVADDPETATTLANAWAAATVRQINDIYAFDPETLSEIDLQVAEAWEEYQGAQDDLELFLSTSEIPDLESRIQQKEILLDAYENALAQSQSARYLQELEAQRRELADLLARDAEIEQQILDARFLAEQLGDEELSLAKSWGLALAYIDLQTQVYGQTPPQLQVDLSGTAPGLTVADVERLMSVLQEKQGEVRSQIALVTQSLGQVSAPNSEALTESAVDEQVAMQVGELAVLQSRLEREMARESELTAARDVAWTAYTSLANKLRELKVEQVVATSEARLAFEALPPSTPSGPRTLLNTAVAGTVGAFLGILGAFAIEYLTPQPVLAGSARRRGLGGWLFGEASGLPGYGRTVEGERQVGAEAESPSNPS